MNYSEILKNKFKDEILNVEILTEDGLKILDICAKYISLKEIEILTKKINTFVDETEWINEFDTISVHSPETQLTFPIEQISDYINQEVKFYFYKPIKNMEFVVGKVKEILDEKIIIIWNNKGQFRKLEIVKNNILKLEKHIKF